MGETLPSLVVFETTLNRACFEANELFLKQKQYISNLLVYQTFFYAKLGNGETGQAPVTCKTLYLKNPMEQKKCDKSCKCHRAASAAQILGRVLIGIFFLNAGLPKILDFAGTVGYMESMGLPLASIGAVLAIIIEVGGALAIIFGLGTRLAALILAIFTLVVTAIFHRYWTYPPEMAFMQSMFFWKNLGIIGGLLVLASYPCGALKSFRHLKRPKA